jgi:hypothetical protein
VYVSVPLPTVFNADPMREEKPLCNMQEEKREGQCKNTEETLKRSKYRSKNAASE